ncbi:MAG TPA: tyrosine-type recombinase/integrase [Acidimicrobiia bacterium]
MSTVKKRCNCAGRCTHSWQATYRKPDGREQTKSFKRQVDAEAWVAGTELTKHRGDWVDPANARRLFGDVARKWRENHIAAVSTLQKLDNDLEKHIYPAFEKKPIGAIARSDIQAWAKGRSLELSPSTVEVIYRYVSAIFRSAVDDGIIAKSPCVNIKLPAIVRPPVVPLTTDQVGAVIDALPARFKGLALVSAGAGLRPGEARGLTVPWFNFLKRELRVEQHLWTPQTGASYMIRPKRGSVGTIPVGDAVVTGLAKHFEDFPPLTRILCVSGQEEILVFTDDKGNPIRRQRWNEIWNRAASAAALPPGTTPHDLRHYYASLLIAKGASVKAVQTMLRHKTANETLNTYAHLWPEDNSLVRRAVDSELSSVVGLGSTDPTADISRTFGSEERSGNIFAGQG